jgi:hypothetical protein
VSACSGIAAQDIEQTVLHTVATLSPRSLEEKDTDILLAKEKISTLEAEITSLKSRIGRMADVIASTSSPMPSLTNKLIADEGRLIQVEKDLVSAKAELGQMSVAHPLELFKQVKDSLEAGGIIERSAIREVLLRIVKRIEVIESGENHFIRILLNEGYYLHDSVPVVGVAVQKPEELASLNLYDP